MLATYTSAWGNRSSPPCQTCLHFVCNEQRFAVNITEHVINVSVQNWCKKPFYSHYLSARKIQQQGRYSNKEDTATAAAAATVLWPLTATWINWYQKRSNFSTDTISTDAQLKHLARSTLWGYLGRNTLYQSVDGWRFRICAGTKSVRFSLNTAITQHYVTHRKSNQQTIYNSEQLCTQNLHLHTEKYSIPSVIERACVISVHDTIDARREFSCFFHGTLVITTQVFRHFLYPKSSPKFVIISKSHSSVLNSQ